ncbi:NlpC/P60 family protein [Angustibacter peucedani]
MTSRPLARVAALAVAGVLAAVVLPAAPASADPSVAQLQHQADALRARLDALAVEQDLAVERYDAANEALLQATTGQVAATTDAIDSQRAAAASADQAAARVRAIYQSGGPIGLTATVLQSASLDDALVRWHAVDDAVGAIVVDDADTAQIQAASVRRHEATAAAAGRSRAVTVARQLAADQAAAAVTSAISRQRALVAKADDAVVALVEQQRQQAAGAALARAVQDAQALGLGGITDAAGHGLEGATAGSQQLPDVPAPNAVAAAAVSAAATRLGLPYVWGATGPTSFDCSGLMLWAYAQAGVPLPRTSRAQYAALPHVPLDQLAPGDLVFYATDVSNPGTIHHVGMYIGNGLSLYAPQTGSNVKIGPVGYGRIIGAARPTLGR